MPAQVKPDYIYLDYAATAPLCEEAARAMEPYMTWGRDNLAVGGNANSLHAPGRAAFEAMEQARRQVARTLGATRPDEVVFTSGATEADDAAVIGLAHAAAEARRAQGRGNFTPHVVTTAIEHDAVLAPARRLEAQGFSVTYLPPNAQGFVSADALADALTDDTVLASVQMANSEVGAIQPIASMARAAHECGALFHTDATQALGKTAVDMGELGVDAASFSGHKIGGPKGVGALYLRARTPFEAYLLGGGQEGARRSGTQNVCGIAGFAAALDAATKLLDDEVARLGKLRDTLYAGLAEHDSITPTVRVEPGSRMFLPNIVHVLVDDLESETLILRFDMMGFGVSGGSACSSHSLEPSHVLKAMGVRGDAAYHALRISMGRYTTASDIDAFLAAVPKALDW